MKLKLLFFAICLAVMSMFSAVNASANCGNYWVPGHYGHYGHWHPGHWVHRHYVPGHYNHWGRWIHGHCE